MKNWQEDLLAITDNSQSAHTVFKKVEAAALALGFEHCAYGLRVPYPVSKPKILVLNNYPTEWQDRYISEGYL